MFKWITCLLRGHKPKFVRNIYGDEILLLNARSEWKCEHCTRPIFKQTLAQYGN